MTNCSPIVRRLCLGLIVAGAISTNAFAQSDGALGTEAVAPQPPRLEFVFESKVQLGELTFDGVYEGHKRAVMQILGGVFEGPSVKGKVLPSNRDWPGYLGNGVRTTDVQYIYVTDDGVVLFVSVNGFRYDHSAMTGDLLKSETVTPAPNLLRVTMRIKAPDDSKYAWMNYNVFVAVAGASGVAGGERLATLRVYRLL